jgi:DNA polymerase III psi subunit
MASNVVAGVVVSPTAFKGQINIRLKQHARTVVVKATNFWLNNVHNEDVIVISSNVEELSTDESFSPLSIKNIFSILLLLL